jgi:hypothetical protein
LKENESIMSQWKNMVSMMVLAGTAALAGTGCLSQGADEEAADDHAAMPADEQAGASQTGEAKEACGLGWGGWGGFGLPCGFGGWGGFGGFGGWGGLGGCGGWFPFSLSVFGPFSGFGWSGFGGCGCGGW